MTAHQLNLFPINKDLKDYDVDELISLHSDLNHYIRSIKYHGSHLNKYIADNATKEHTCINIDCLQEKRDRLLIRITEVKYLAESLKVHQEHLLKRIAKIARLFNNLPEQLLKEYGLTGRYGVSNIEVFVVYVDIDKGEVLNHTMLLHDLVSNKKYVLRKKVIIDKWLGLLDIDISPYEEYFNNPKSIRRVEDEMKYR